MITTFLKKKLNLEIVFLFLISALAYLPYAARLTYYLDDWYYIYNDVVAGPNIFHPMFNIDRPARGYFFDIYFSLLGPHPLPYHLGAYLWRLLAGLSAFWLFNILWPRNRRFNFFAALLFIFYPGYSWWISAIEYQPMIASLALQVISVVLTLMAVQASRLLHRGVYLAGAILTGWMYIALVDYAVGMEVVRFICVYLVVSHKDQTRTFFKNISISIKAWAWNVLIPGGFVFWRLFLFEGHRKATDISFQLNKFLENPANSIWQWLSNLYLSIVNVGFNAWLGQFYLRFAEAGHMVSYKIVFVTGIVILLLFIAYRLGSQIFTSGDDSQGSTAGEAVFLGSVSLLFGLLPVVVFNRYVNLTIYSHYGLPSSLASAILLAGIIFYLLRWKQAQTVILSAFIVIAVITHSLIAEKTTLLENSVANFWWQASWRIPQLRPDATLITLYPYPKVTDGDLGLSEAANLIYFSQPSSDIPVRYPVSTIMPTNANIALILAGEHKKLARYRTFEMLINYENILILSQPTPLSCVRVIDGTYGILSSKDPENIKKIASYSNVENIRSHMEFQTPQTFAFGPEPDHGWCYFFEKADLAAQNLNWEEAARFGDEALSRELSPEDNVEWLPFLQAYAMLGDEERVKTLFDKISTNNFLSEQVCSMFNGPDSELALSVSMKALTTSLFCK